MLSHQGVALYEKRKRHGLGEGMTFLEEMSLGGVGGSSVSMLLSLVK